MRNNLLIKEIKDACLILFDFSAADYFKIINDLSNAEIKKAYRKKIMIYHPDRSNNNKLVEKNLTEIFKKLTSAYNLLLNYKNLNIKYENKNFTKKEYNYSHNENNSLKDFYYSGFIPERKLRFAEYLFYTKIISWKTLINSIITQYKTRPRLGEIFLTLEYLNNSEVLDIILKNKFKEKFGETALKLSYVTEEELKKALELQRKYNRPIGRYFIENNIISEAKMKEYFINQIKHNLKFKH